MNQLFKRNALRLISSGCEILLKKKHIVEWLAQVFTCNHSTIICVLAPIYIYIYIQNHTCCYFIFFITLKRLNFVSFFWFSCIFTAFNYPSLNSMISFAEHFFLFYFLVDFFLFWFISLYETVFCVWSLCLFASLSFVSWCCVMW